ncbi:MAG: hypothetical protein E7Z87_06070 [Cyanobacteria bacterium SIG26]|nr:hypothetical protein [Cyanobacteria bacterium SIG26]
MHNISLLNNFNVSTVNTAKDNNVNSRVTNPIKTVTDGDKQLLHTLDVLSILNRANIADYRLRISSCDGAIGEFKQGGMGDCWLLSGLRALSTTPIGSDIINNSITKNEDGSVSVNFKGLNTSYAVTEEEFNRATQKFVTSPDGVKERVYSNGDADVLVFELAVEKLRTDISDGKFDEIKVPNYAKTILNPKKPLNDGSPAQLFYLLTGNEVCGINGQNIQTPDGKVLCKNNREKLSEFFDRYLMDNKKYAATFNVADGLTVVDVSGREIQLRPKHEYAIEGSVGSNLIVTNPHNSARKLVIPLVNIIDNIGGLNYQNLKDNYDFFDDGLKKHLIKSTAANNYVNKNY